MRRESRHNGLERLLSIKRNSVRARGHSPEKFGLELQIGLTDQSYRSERAVERVGLERVGLEALGFKWW
jgi:hypothetical protein